MSHPWLSDLTTEATLGDLPSHDFTLSPDTPGDRVAAEFERRPDLPGVIVRQGGGDIAAMISRGLFFQRLSRPFSREIYLKRPLRMFLDESLPEPLILLATRRIADAAVLALDRQMAHAYEPVVVRDSSGDLRVIDIYVLLRAQAHLLGVAQAAMLQSEKLASVGQLAAGVAHEINNPLAFVTNNLAIIQRDAKAMAAALALYRQSEPAIAKQYPDLYLQLCTIHDRFDLPYTAANLHELAARCREGLIRIREIVKDLREFARLDIGDETDVDLNASIGSTANIIAGRAKSADVTIDLQLLPVPTVPGNPAKINQVVMNLLANAVDACHSHGRVTVRSRPVRDAVSIEIEDTGAGIDPSIADRVFDPFFTTKPPGHGTGLGLTISYGVVRDHSGVIDFVTQPGKGTTFRVLLPLYRNVAIVATTKEEEHAPVAV
jgi:signal transduction histidine kinase